MSTLFIDRQNCDLDVEAGRITLREDGERRGTWPLALVERLVVNRGVRLSGRLIAALGHAGIGLMLEPGRSRDAHATVVPAAADRGLRRDQYALAADPARRARIAAGLVRARIDGAAALVAVRAPGSPALSRMQQALRRLGGPPPPVATLRGIEGAAAAAFFEAFASMVPPPFAFAGRNRRPPRDPVNVCLSIGYTMAYFDAQRAAAACGLDPAIGVYHDQLAGRDSLACDLMEPVRPLVERWVLDLLGSGAVGLGEFRTGDGSCVLMKPGRRAVYGAYEDDAAGPVRARLGQEADGFAAALRDADGSAPAAADGSAGNRR